jgi:hypothetical protein
LPPKPASLTDWHRLLIGNAPAAFLFEVLLRTAAVYLALVVLVRLLGKRMSGQVSNIELGVMIVLGAVVAGAFQLPDRGVVPALVLLATLLALQRAVTAAGARWPRFERLTQGGSKMLVKNALLQLDEFRAIGISREQVFAALRARDIRHLGQVERLYLEASGEFSVFRARTPGPGLSVFPRGDGDFERRASVLPGAQACALCGAVRSRARRHAHPCERCGHTEFEAALRDGGEPEADEKSEGSHAA